MKILVCCGSGLGSSFMIEMSVNDMLAELGVSGIEVTHSDLSSAKGADADFYIGTRDIAPELETIGKPVISLDNMLAKDELKEKLEKMLKQFNVL